MTIAESKPRIPTKFVPENYKIVDGIMIDMDLEEYPAEDLFEDGELTEREVEEKIVNEWYDGKIVLMRRRYNGSM